MGATLAPVTGHDDRRTPARGRPVWPVVAILLIVGGIALRVATDGGVALPSALQDGATLAISVFIESLPFIILGVLISTIVQVWLPGRWIDRALPRTPWLRRAALSLLGIVLPVCECGNVPLARGLISRGLTPAESITFLLAAPILNPITILTTYQVFGWENGILLGRIIGGFVVANLIGWMFSRHPDQSSLLTPFVRRELPHAP